MRIVLVPSNVWARRPARALLLSTTFGLVLAAGIAIVVSSDGGSGWVTAAAVVITGMIGLLGVKLGLEAAVEGRRLRVLAASAERAREQVRVAQDRAVDDVRASLERVALDHAARAEDAAEERSRLRHDVETSTLRVIEFADATKTELESADARLHDLVARLDGRVSSLSHRLDLERRARMHLASTPRATDGRDVAIAEIRDVVERVESGEIPAEHISDDFPDEVIGLSGRKFRTLVCELVRLLGDRGCYLEVGTYRGKTICASCVSNPSVLHVGIDNFSQHDLDGANRSVLDRLIARLGITNLDFRDVDFETFMADRSLAGTRDIAVYYFDASHDHRSQLIALLHGANQVVPGGVMLVDDCNYTHVRAATYDFLDANPDWALMFERYTEGHPMRADDETRQQMNDGWWNGVHLLVHDPDRLVQRLERFDEPGTRQFFLGQHPMGNCDTSAVTSRFASTFA